MSVEYVFDPQTRLKLMGPKKLPIDELVRRGQELMLRIGERPQKFDDPDTSYVSRNRSLMYLEEVVHELAHHATLQPDTLFDKKRTETIGETIRKLTPAQADGNELDTLAVEINAFWWLRVRIDGMRLVEVAADGNLNYFTRHQAMRMVKELRRTPTCWHLGRDLAQTISNTKKL